MSLTVTDATFEQEVLKAPTPVIVDFWAEWCAPCRAVSPLIDEIAKEYEGKVKVGKVNVDQNPQHAGNYGVMSIPTIIFFKNGQPLKTIIGVQGKDTYKRNIEEVLAS